MTANFTNTFTVAILLSSSSCLPVPFILCLACKTQLTLIQFHLMQKVSMELIYSLPLFSLRWLRWVFDAVQAFSACGEEGMLLLEVCRASLPQLLLLQSMGSRASVVNGPVVVANQLSCPEACGIFLRTRD